MKARNSRAEMTVVLSPTDFSRPPTYKTSTSMCGDTGPSTDNRASAQDAPATVVYNGNQTQYVAHTMTASPIVN